VPPKDKPTPFEELTRKVLRKTREVFPSREAVAEEK
jgi:hypothetical protein